MLLRVKLDGKYLFISPYIFLEKDSSTYHSQNELILHKERQAIKGDDE